MFPYSFCYVNLLSLYEFLEIFLFLPFPSTSSFPQNPFCLSCIEINKLAELQVPDSQTGLVDPCVLMNFMERKKERKAKSVLHISLGITAMNVDSISVASHNSLL